tara:strand:+ start:481 stop:735 length:255 start_codon:yes stop_codon:yes gene_type:complete
VGSNPAAPTNDKAVPAETRERLFSLSVICSRLDTWIVLRHCPLKFDQIIRSLLKRGRQMTAIYAIVAFLAVMAILNKMSFGRFD